MQRVWVRYRARNTKLQRDVALKILPETMARDAQRMARFEREARALAFLNHPNIASHIWPEEGGPDLVTFSEGRVDSESSQGLRYHPINHQLLSDAYP